MASIARAGTIEEAIGLIHRVLGAHATGYLGEFKSIEKLTPPVTKKGEQYIRNACELIEVLLKVGDEASVRAWFLGLRPEFDNRSAGVALKEDYRKVLSAARGFGE